MSRDSFKKVALYNENCSSFREDVPCKKVLGSKNLLKNIFEIYSVRKVRKERTYVMEEHLLRHLLKEDG